MYRILLVDDESYVVDWISNLLETQFPRELDVYRAYTAEEAIRWMSRAKIDAIISDIRMPGMSGLDLARFVKKSWPQCKIILLTAYAEFDYAYAALGNQVSGYLLKSEKDSRIMEEVGRVLDEIDRELDIGPVLNSGPAHLDIQAQVRRELLFQLVKGEYGQIGPALEQISRTGFPLSADSGLYLALGQRDCPESDPADALRTWAGICQTVQFHLDAKFCCAVLNGAHGQLICLILPGTEDGGAPLMVQAEGLLETIQASCQRTFNASLSFILHATPVVPAELSTVYWGMRRLLIQKDCDAGCFVLRDNSCAPAENTEQEADLSPLFDRMRSSLYENRQQEVLASLQTVGERLNAFKSLHDTNALYLYFTVATLLLNYVNQKKLQFRIAFQFGMQDLFCPQSCGSWGQAAECLFQMARAVFALQNEEKGTLADHISAALRGYIDEHLAEDISLIRLSEVTGYNPSYLSRVYRENTGETINDYISRQKMKRIGELLQNTQKSIQEVARDLGFESRTYFNRFIKRNTGLTPREYRDSLNGA